MKTRVVGIGEIVLDHVFEFTRGRGYYRGCRGGGSVGNVVSNLSALGVQTSFVGVGGKDKSFEVCRRDFESLHVDVDGLRQLNNRISRQIFEELGGDIVKSESLHSFSGRCPVCEKQLNELQVAHFSDISNTPNIDLGPDTILCFDRLTRNRLELVHAARQSGASAILDLGRTSFFRWIPTMRLTSYLKEFDLVQCTATVAQSIVRRLEFSSIVELVGQTRLPTLLVTMGRHGLSIVGQSNTGSICSFDLPAVKNIEVYDDSGAGDALLSNIILRLIQGGMTNRTENPILFPAYLIADFAESLLDKLRPVLTTMGARGHLPGRMAGGVFGDDSLIGCPIEGLREIIKSNKGDSCAICGQSDEISGVPQLKEGKVQERLKSIKRIGARRNVSLLIDRAFHAAESLGVEKAREWINGAGERVITVGTGGSFSAAVFVSYLLNSSGRWLSVSMKPQEVIRLRPKADCFVIFSYSGRTPDCAAVIKDIHARNAGKIILMTLRRESELGDLLNPGKGDTVFMYGSSASAGRKSKGERGFVSIAGTISPCACILAASVGRGKMEHLFEICNAVALDEELRSSAVQLAKRYKSSPKIAIFGSGWAWPAVIDLESKLCEGGIIGAQVHETKDFSHGRFISVFGHEREYAGSIFLSSGQRGSYEEMLGSVLSSTFPMTVIESSERGEYGGFELLVRVQFFSHWLSNSLGIDLSRPADPIPPRGLSLYRWDKGLN